MARRKKWALITGVSAGGLGDALTQGLLANDINVIATGLKLSDLDYLSNNTSSQLERLQLDVTSASSIAAAVKATEAITDGMLSLLINNAGYGYMMPLLDADIDKVKRNFDVNVFGVLAVTQAFFPLLRAARGKVVNQASVVGLPNISQPFIGSYSASKTTVLDLSNTMRVELAPFGVKVVTLVTGDVKTQFWNSASSYHVGLPEGSLYFPIRSKVEEMMKGRTGPPGSHTAERWAKAVVKDLLRPDPPVYVRRGYLATTLAWLSWLCPVWFWDWQFYRMADLDKLRETVTRRGGPKHL